MQRLIIVLSISLLLALCSTAMSPWLASAHVLESSNGVGAIIHIDPDDDPIAGERSVFYFEFKDKNDKFLASDCDCTMTVRQDDLVLKTEKLKAIGKLSASASLTLPEQGLYTIKVAGRPLQPEKFTNFAFDYTFRVSRGVAAARSDTSQKKLDSREKSEQSNVLLIAGSALAGLFVVGLVGRIVYNSRHKNHA